MPSKKNSSSDVQVHLSGDVASALERLSKDEKKDWDSLIQTAINLSIGMAYGKYSIVDADLGAEVKMDAPQADRTVKIYLNGATSGELLRASTASKVLPDALVERGINTLLQTASGRYRIVETAQ